MTITVPVRSALRLLLFALTSVLTISACDYGVRWEDDAYVVAWLDTGDNVTLARKLDGHATIGRVGPRIRAVGSDERYVLVEREQIEPMTDALPTGARSCYYVNKRLDADYAEAAVSVVGPLTLEEFEAKKVEFGLPDFQKYF